jgi:transcriptional regulator with XRE-family HTH domain
MARINTDKALAGRLRKLRAAIFAENSTQFAKRIGVSIQRLNNFENGFPLSIDVANRIRAAVPGLGRPSHPHQCVTTIKSVSFPVSWLIP